MKTSIYSAICVGVISSLTCLLLLIIGKLIFGNSAPLWGHFSLIIATGTAFFYLYKMIKFPNLTPSGRRTFLIFYVVGSYILFKGYINSFRSLFWIIYFFIFQTLLILSVLKIKVIQNLCNSFDKDDSYIFDDDGFMETDKDNLEKIMTESNDIESYISKDFYQRIAHIVAMYNQSNLFYFMRLEENPSKKNILKEKFFFDLKIYLFCDIDELPKALSEYWGIENGVDYENLFNHMSDSDNAWDLARIAAVTKQAYNIGMIDKKSAAFKMEIIGKTLTQEYSSWRNIFEDLVYGKLSFNNHEMLNNIDINQYSSITDIMTRIDLLFNSIDSPLSNYLLSDEENIFEESENFFANKLLLKTRVENWCNVYKNECWGKFYTTSSKICDYYKKIILPEKYEEILYIHGDLSGKIEDFKINFIITTSNLIVNKNGKFTKDSKRLPLKYLDVKDLSIKKDLKVSLNYKNEIICENLYISGKEEIYLDIIKELLTFVALRG